MCVFLIVYYVQTHTYVRTYAHCTCRDVVHSSEVTACIIGKSALVTWCPFWRGMYVISIVSFSASSMQSIHICVVKVEIKFTLNITKKFNLAH